MGWGHRISTHDLQDSGILQEVNRQYLHPLGLSLSVCHADGEITVFDYRGDPEGIYFGRGVIDLGKAARVASLVECLTPIRVERLGYWVQPILP